MSLGEWVINDLPSIFSLLNKGRSVKAGLQRERQVGPPDLYRNGRVGAGMWASAGPA